MKYRTYRKLRKRAKAARRIIFTAIVFLVAVTLLIIPFALNSYSASAKAATCAPESEGDTTEKPYKTLNCDLPEELQEYTYYMCDYYGIDFELAMAVMYTESNFDSAAVSNTGDYGIMQINEINIPELSDKLGVTDITDPYQNIRCGVYILGELSKQYTEPARVLMAYNIGDYGSSALWEQGVHSTDYSEKVLSKYAEYHGGLEE